MNMNIYTLYRINNTEPNKFVLQPDPQSVLQRSIDLCSTSNEYEDIQIISDKQHPTDIYIHVSTFHSNRRLCKCVLQGSKKRNEYEYVQIISDK